MDERSGRVFVDRVSINLHIGADSFGRREVQAEAGEGGGEGLAEAGVRTWTRSAATSPDGNGNQDGVTLRHDQGEVSVTRDHVVLVDGEFVAAGEARVGQMVEILVPAAIGGVFMKTEARIQEIAEWKAGVVSPLTHSGRILAGGLWQRHRRAQMQQRRSATVTDIGSDGTAAQGGADAFSFTLVSTALSSPANVQLLLITMPSAMKLASVLFPAQVQRSFVVEQASLVVGCLTNRMYAAVTGLAQSTPLWAARLRSSAESSDSDSTGSAGSIGLAIHSTAVTAAEAIALAISLVLFVILDLCVGWPFVGYHSCLWFYQHLCRPPGMGMVWIVGMSLLAAVSVPRLLLYGQHGCLVPRYTLSTGSIPISD
jgi:hypothetical protein